MPKVLTEAQVERYQRDGCLSPVRAMSAERARHYPVHTGRLMLPQHNLLQLFIFLRKEDEIF